MEIVTSQQLKGLKIYHHGQVIISLVRNCHRLNSTKEIRNFVNVLEQIYPQIKRETCYQMAYINIRQHKNTIEFMIVRPYDMNYYYISRSNILDPTIFSRIEQMTPLDFFCELINDQYTQAQLMEGRKSK